MNRLAILLLCFVAAMPAQTPQSAAQPFSAKVRAQYWTETRRYAERLGTFSRAGNGSWAFATEVDHPTSTETGPLQRVTYLLNAVRRSYIMTEPYLRTAVELPIIDNRELARLRMAYGDCALLTDGTWKEVGSSKILGYRVIEVEEERTERSSVTKWVAPDLQCFSLKRVDVIDGDVRVREEVTSIQAGEPDRSAFEIPSGYSAVSPLEMEDRYRAKFGKPLFGEQAVRMEEQYQRALSLRKIVR